MTNKVCPINHALKNQRDTTKDFFMDNLIKFSPLQLQKRLSKPDFLFFFIFLLLLRDSERPQVFVMSIYSTSAPLKNYIYHLLSAIVGHSTSVSITAAVRQNVGKTH